MNYTVNELWKTFGQVDPE